MAPVEYNYRDLAALGPEWHGWTGEMHGISAFLRRGDRVFHTYSSYARGALSGADTAGAGRRAGTAYRRLGLRFSSRFCPALLS